MDRGRTEASAPTDVLQEVCGAGDREGRPYGRVQEVPALSAGGVEPRPYGGVAGKCLHGIPQSASLTAPFRQGAKGTGVTDCHDQCAHWSRNDTLQGVPWAGRCGERTERCRWQMQRGERVAAVKISSVRRKAARKFWAPQQDHRPLRVRGKECLRRDDVGIVPYGVRGKECLQDGAAGHMGPALQAQILYLFMCKTNKKYRSL